MYIVIISFTYNNKIMYEQKFCKLLFTLTYKNNLETMKAVCMNVEKSLNTETYNDKKKSIKYYAIFVLF